MLSLLPKVSFYQGGVYLIFHWIISAPLLVSVAEWGKNTNPPWCECMIIRLQEFLCTSSKSVIVLHL